MTILKEAVVEIMKGRGMLTAKPSFPSEGRTCLVRDNVIVTRKKTRRVGCYRTMSSSRLQGLSLTTRSYGFVWMLKRCLKNTVGRV